MRSVLLAAALLMVAQPALAGQSVGNGGDLIMCVKSTDNPFIGTMNLDYVLTYQPAPLATVASVDASLDRIQKLIEAKVPGLLESFRKFRGSLWNETDPTQPYMWTPVAGGLVAVHDEDLNSAERVPDNCRNGTSIPLLQAVIRQDPVIIGSTTVVVHKYVKDKILEVAKVNPLQISFLLVHEWLWNLSDNVHRNRMIDRFFHSKEFETMAPDAVERYLVSLGLKIPQYVPFLFGDNLCKAEISSTVESTVRKAYKYNAQHGQPATAEIPLGTFHVRTMKRNCTPGNCTAWQDSDFLSNQMMLGSYQPQAFFTAPDPLHAYFTLSGMDKGRRFNFWAACPLENLAKIDCAAILDPFDNQPIQIEGSNFNVRMSGNTNGNCIHMTYNGRGNETGTKWVEWRYGMYFWFVQ